MKKIAAVLALLLVASGCASQTQDGDTGKRGFQDMMQEASSPDVKVKYDVSSSLREYRGLNLTYYRIGGERKIVARQETPGGTFVTTSYVLRNGTVICNVQPSSTGKETVCRTGLVPDSHIPVLPGKWNFTNLTEAPGNGCRAFSGEVNSSAMRRVPVSGDAEASFCFDSESGVFTRMNVSSEQEYISIQAEKVSDPEASKIRLERKIGIAGHCSGSYEVDLTPFRSIDTATFSIGDFNKTVDLPEKFETGVYSFPKRVLHEGSNTITVYAGGEVEKKACYSS